MKQSSKKHELGTAALYCRLSRDDNMDSESNSIQNQRKILQKAAKDKGYTDTVFFVDDGITGTTMKRPGFQKMLTAIEAGYISAVFVKDLSRLGRNYIEVGKLTEEFFPLHDIRLVAVSDGVDSDEGEDRFYSVQKYYERVLCERHFQEAPDREQDERKCRRSAFSAALRLHQKPRRFPLLGGRAGGCRGRAPDLPHGAGGVRAGGNGSAACRRWRGQSHLLLAQPWDEPGRVKKHRGAYQVGAYHRQEDPHLAGILRRCDQFQKLLQVLQDEKADREPGGKPGDLPQCP